MQLIKTLFFLLLSVQVIAQKLQLTLNQGRFTGSTSIVETPDRNLTYSSTVLPPALFFGAGKLGNLTSLSPTKGLIWSNDYQFPKTAFPFSLANEPDGGYLWSGLVFDDARSFFLSRLDAQGNVIWANQYGSNASIDTINQGQTQSLALSDGNFMLAGGAGVFANDLRNNDLLLAKIAPDGDQIWLKRYCFSCAGDIETTFGSVAEAPDGGFLICGSYLEQTFDGQRVLLIKTDASGKAQWVKTYFDAQSTSFLSDETGRQAAYLPNGNIALIANQDDFAANSGALIAEIKPNGDLIRASRIKVNPASQYSLSLNELLIEDDNALTIAAGVTQDSTPSVSIEQNLLFQIRLDGSIVWQRNYYDEVLEGFGTAQSDVTKKATGGYAYLTNNANGFDELFQVLSLTDETGVNGCELPIDLKVQNNVQLTQETETITELSGNNPTPFQMVKVDFPLVINTPIADFPKDTFICQPDTVVLRVDGQNIDSYLWSTGQTSPEIAVSAPGKYTVTVRNDLLCYEATDTIDVAEKVDCIPVVMDTLMVGIPNAFTPNSDNENERFRPIGQGFITESLQIFNRWGGLIYQSMDANAAWDGRVRGADAPVDVYVYVIRLKENGATKQYVGEVTLLR
jgi:gliding motility-associated-like protein